MKVSPVTNEPAIVAVESKTEGITAVLNDKKDAVTLSGELSAPDTNVTTDTISLTFTYTDEKGVPQIEDIDISIQYPPADEGMPAFWSIMSSFVEIGGCINIKVDGTVSVKVPPVIGKPAIVAVESKTEGITAALNDKKDAVTLSGELSEPAAGITQDKVILTFAYIDSKNAEKTKDIEVSLKFSAASDDTASFWAVTDTELVVEDNLKTNITGIVVVKERSVVTTDKPARAETKTENGVVTAIVSMDKVMEIINEAKGDKNDAVVENLVINAVEEGSEVISSAVKLEKKAVSLLAKDTAGITIQTNVGEIIVPASVLRIAAGETADSSFITCICEKKAGYAFESKKETFNVGFYEGEEPAFEKLDVKSEPISLMLTTQFEPGTKVAVTSIENDKADSLGVKTVANNRSVTITIPYLSEIMIESLDSEKPVSKELTATFEKGEDAYNGVTKVTITRKDGQSVIGCFARIQVETGNQVGSIVIIEGTEEGFIVAANTSAKLHVTVFDPNIGYAKPIAYTTTDKPIIIP